MPPLSSIRCEFKACVHQPCSVPHPRPPSRPSTDLSPKSQAIWGSALSSPCCPRKPHYGCTAQERGWAHPPPLPGWQTRRGRGRHRCRHGTRRTFPPQGFLAGPESPKGQTYSRIPSSRWVSTNTHETENGSGLRASHLAPHHVLKGTQESKRQLSPPREAYNCRGTKRLHHTDVVQRQETVETE